MAELRALLLTDVVDSTKNAASLGADRNGEVWAAHDRLARGLLGPWRGRELERTDGVLVMFSGAADAVGYALAYHRGLAALDPPLIARAGIHIGPLVVRENPAEHVARGVKLVDVDGLAIAVTARVQSVAIGGQTLLSGDARDDLGDTPHRLVSHGFWRLKGAPDPVELLEVGEEGAPWLPPKDGEKVYRVVRSGDLWLPARDVKHSLPAERDAFVGRHADLLDLARRIDESALVSVLGAAGTGKTRLVTRYGWAWLGEWPGGVWFCDVSDARDVEGIVQAVARGLDLPLGNDPIAHLGHAIAGRGRCLVVLDNLEQVARHAPETLGRWLDRAPQARFVTTTREVLGLPGERIVALSSLDPAAAVALFEVRAVQAKPDFVVTDGDRRVLTDLVRLLDGLPLAIELAAARVRVMPPKVLLKRMSERFKLLASSGGRPTRQATLRAALDWSWELLSDAEKAALAQLSVFEGGFTLASCEAVLDVGDAWPTDVVQALVDKSLVRRVSEARFDLLVSVHEYAADQLRGDERARAEARHGAHLAAYGEVAFLDTIHLDAERRLELASELDNLVWAARRAVARGDGEIAAAALRAAWTVLLLRGPVLIAVDLAADALRLPALRPRDRGELARVLGQALARLGRHQEALPRYEAALAAAREAGDRRLEGAVHGSLGALAFEQGRTEASAAHHDAALAIHREVGDRRLEGVQIGNIANVYLLQGRFEEARPLFDEALEVARGVRDRRFEGIVLGNLGILQRNVGELDAARASYEAALAVAREVGDRMAQGFVLGNLGQLHAHQGRTDEARACFDAALALNREIGNRLSEGIALCGRARVEHAEGRSEVARATLAEAEALAAPWNPESRLGREVTKTRAAIDAT